MTRAQAEALLAYVDAALDVRTLPNYGSLANEQICQRCDLAREAVLALCDDGPMPGAEDEAAPG